MPKSPSELPNNQVKPDPTLEKRTRRKFTADYKLRIITEADSCKHGELGTLLQRWTETLLALESVKNGAVVEEKVVIDWLKSWGSKNEKSPPKI